MREQRQRRRRLPPWLTSRVGASAAAREVAALLEGLRLNTVCAEAHCPNQHECFSRRTAAFLIMGDACTRDCRFCAVASGEPRALKPGEPDAVAEAAARLSLRHVVITSVTRDDLPDGGAAHFARTVRAVRGRLGEAVIEVLVPDFLGRREDIDAVLAARPDVFNHNVETVPRLYARVRPQADYRRSLDVLRHAAQASSAHTKSGLMVGLGETAEEVTAVMGDLRAAGCELLTIGQYLAPSDAHLPVERFVRPEEFEAWEAEARATGFAAVSAGPFVRSSYMAEQVLEAGLRTARERR
jgi:lipoic acid synthetase